MSFINSYGEENLDGDVMETLKKLYDDGGLGTLSDEVNKEHKEGEENEEYEDEEDEEDEALEIEECAIDPSFPTGEAYNRYISEINWDTLTSEQEKHIFEQRMLQISQCPFSFRQVDIGLSLCSVIATMKFGIWNRLNDIPNANVPRYYSLTEIIDVYKDPISKYIGRWDISIEDMKHVLLLGRKLRLAAINPGTFSMKRLHLYEERMNDLQREAYLILKPFIDNYPCSLKKCRNR